MKTLPKHGAQSNSEFRDFFPITIDTFNQFPPAFNITEDNNCFCVDVITPGCAKEDFKVKIEDNTIAIEVFIRSGKKIDDVFACSFRLPDTIKEELITAIYIDGLLKLNIPKRAAVK